MNLKVSFRRNIAPDYPLTTAELALDEKQCALLVVDMQNDYLHPQGLFASAKVDVSGARAIVKPLAQVAEACRKAGARVVYTQTGHREDQADMDEMYREILHLRNNRHMTIGARIGPPGKKLGTLTQGTWNTEVVEELTPQPGDVAMNTKRKYNAFHQTDLELLLRNLGVRTLFFTGVTTSVCVETTFREAYIKNFRCILLEDCTWERFPEWGEATKRILSINFGYLSNSTDLIEALETKSRN